MSQYICDGLPKITNGKIEGFDIFPGTSKGLKYDYYLVDGKKEGQYRTYHDNGQLWIVTNYVNDKLNGPHLTYLRSGNLFCEHTYIDGKIEGKFIIYHFNGKVSEISHYQNDIQVGLTEIYDSNGKFIKHEKRIVSD